MPIPHNIAAQWSEFVAEWCLGIEPFEPPREVERAFAALRKLWPEFLDRLEAQAAQGSRGVSRVVPAITLGLTLAACEPLSGFDPVMARVRRGEKSAMAELQFAAALVRCGYIPVLEPQVGPKTLDCSVGIGSERVYVEVIAPEQAAEIKDAYTTIQRMSTEIVEQTMGIRTEVLLLEEPGLRFDAILGAVTATLPDGRVHSVEDVATVRRDFLGSLAPNVGPLITDLDPYPVIGAANSRVGGEGLSTSATVRLKLADERAHRLLSKELSHFSSKQRNILAIRVTEVPGGLTWWWPLVLRWFQPSRNRRVGAIVLYEQAVRFDEKVVTRQRWRVIENPYAYRPVPSPMINAISALDESAAWNK